MNTPLIIIYVLHAILLLMTANMHGKPKTGKYNFWTSLIATGLTLVMVWWALGWKLI